MASSDARLSTGYGRAYARDFSTSQKLTATKPSGGCKSINKSLNFGKSGGSAVAARDPLDFGANQALDQTGQIVVEPGFQHRAQHLPRRPLDQILVARQQGFGQSLEGGADFRVAR